MMIAPISYAINNPSTSITCGPSATVAVSSTVGQSAGAPSRYAALR
jgi:hypothetical protein